jgi:D-xylose transport system substrate-binding protein
MNQINRISLLVALFALLATPNSWAKVKIGFILSTMQEERYQRDRDVFTKTIESLGGEVVFASCNNNEQIQAAQVDNLLSQGVKALVIQPVNGDTAAGLVKQAKQDQVPVVDYDRLITNAPIDFYVTEDSIKVGKLQAEAVAKALKGKGNVILLMGQAGHSVAEARTKGALDELAKHPGIKVVVKQYHHGWSPNLAMTTTENALTQHKNNIQAVIANNSGMAHGAIQALAEQKLTGKVFVAGADADLMAIKDIVAGKQQFEVLISIEDMAASAAKAAWALAHKQEPQSNGTVSNGTVTVKTMNTPVFAITKDNLEARIFKTGFHTKQAVFGSN